MANNTTLPGTGEVYSSDEVENSSGVDVNFQIIKLGTAEAGDEPVHVSKANPLPVSGFAMEELLVQIVDRLDILIRHHEHINDEIFKAEDVINDSY